MNGDGEGFDEGVKMEKLVFMWGYLPGALPQRSPILSPVVVRLPPSSIARTSWKDVCGGGCGFAMAISGNFFFYFSLSPSPRSYISWFDLEYFILSLESKREIFELTFYIITAALE